MVVMALPTCGGCGHLPICHRRGPCEYVKRIGWMPAHSRFTEEVPCTCVAWQDKKKTKPTS